MNGRRSARRTSKPTSVPIPQASVPVDASWKKSPERIGVEIRAGLNSSERAQRSFRLHFPDVATAMEAAIKKSGVKPLVGELAGRHLICAEALIEVLNSLGTRPRSQRPLAVEKVVEAYSQLVPERVMGFNRRSLTIRQAIQAAFPSVDVSLIARAYKKGIIGTSEIACLLEEPRDYQVFIRKLNSLDFLAPPVPKLK